MDFTDLYKKFSGQYGNESEKPLLFFAPGRVNLIGEHTDYNGGYVLPCAIQFGTYLLIRKTSDINIKLASVNFPEKTSVPGDIPLEIQPVRWFNYPLGVMKQFEKAGMPVSGIELLFYGDIPNGAGLSSSASIEMVTAFAINELFGFGVQMIDLIKYSQKAEHEFAGVMCGIMDQFAVGMGKKDHAVFLNTQTMEYKHVPVILEHYNLVIANTNKQRGLADSKYNERVAECQKALSELGGISTLSDISFMEFYKEQEKIQDETIRKRARHVISENQRVLNSVKALSRNDLPEFGAIMNASHESLRDNYEVTGPELDILVEEAWNARGCAGARMTGAGFGGCTINLVEKQYTADFIKNVGDHYHKNTGLTADFYISEISDGVRQM